MFTLKKVQKVEVTDRMYLSLLQLNPASEAVQRDLRDVQDLHRTVMKAFPAESDGKAEARSAFNVLYRLENNRSISRILLYVQSLIEPDWTCLPNDYLLFSDGIFNPAIKRVDEIYTHLKQDDVLRFKLRANPTRRIQTKSAPDGTKSNGRRVPLRGFDKLIGWLKRKSADHGFELLQATITAMGQTELLKSRSTSRTFQGVLYEGILIIRDREKFIKTLSNGIGPGKAFGFGLLSIGPE